MVVLYFVGIPMNSFHNSLKNMFFSILDIAWKVEQKIVHFVFGSKEILIVDAL